jgi:membrane-bound lytic murein transglycosylase MltF
MARRLAWHARDLSWERDDAGSPCGHSSRQRALRGWHTAGYGRCIREINGRLTRGLIAAATLAAAVYLSAQTPTEKGRIGLTLAEIVKPWTGDLDGMVERRMIRVLTAYSRTQYFIDRGTPRGTAYDQGKLLEDALNKQLATSRTSLVNVLFVPVSRSELIPALLAGKGDVIMADLTVTPERAAVVDFTDPWIDGVEEIVVTSPGGPVIESVDDLSGKEVFVRESSSYYQSLLALNTRLSSEGKAPVTLTPAPEELEDEDLLEMANAGLVNILVVDNHKAWFWQRVLPKLKLYPTVTLRKGGEIAWAIRKNSPQLGTALDKFLAVNGRDSLNARMIFRRYLLSTQYVKGASADQSRKRFLSLVALFRKYGTRYNMDWMLMAAQGYQESRLDQNAKSQVGAIGVMQVMPETGKELNVGDIHLVEPNINAGVKFIRTMIDRNFANEPMDDLDKVLFAFAAYNAGQGRVRQLRREAADRGLDPNVWFNNVERVASERIGRETVNYVSNIYKYYVSYLLIQGEYLKRQQLKKGAAP